MCGSRLRGVGLRPSRVRCMRSQEGAAHQLLVASCWLLVEKIAIRTSSLNQGNASRCDAMPV